MMVELSHTLRDRLVNEIVRIVSRLAGPDFDFVLVLRENGKPSYVMTDVIPERARSMLIDALHHPDMP